MTVLAGRALQLSPKPRPSRADQAPRIRAVLSPGLLLGIRGQTRAQKPLVAPSQRPRRHHWRPVEAGRRKRSCLGQRHRHDMPNHLVPHRLPLLTPSRRGQRRLCQPRGNHPPLLGIDVLPRPVRQAPPANTTVTQRLQYASCPPTAKPPRQRSGTLPRTSSELGRSATLQALRASQKGVLGRETLPCRRRLAGKEPPAKSPNFQPCSGTLLLRSRLM